VNPFDSVDHGIYQAHRDPGAVHKILPNCHVDWRFGVGGTISWSTPARDPAAGLIAVGAHKTDGCLLGIQPDGTKSWDFKAPLAGEFFSSGAISGDGDGSLYMGASNGVFYRLDPRLTAGCPGGNCTPAQDCERIKWCYDTMDPKEPSCWKSCSPVARKRCSAGGEPIGPSCCRCGSSPGVCKPASASSPCPATAASEATASRDEVARR
jgi:hypothetical protein